MLKKILIGIAVLVVLVVAGLVALVTLVDVDHYKPQIESMAHDKLDRTLTFEGKLSLSVFPNIAVSLPRTTLSEHGSDAPFLSLDHARVSLAVLPLFAGRLEAGTASLYGLRVAIERHADGSTNLDDLAGKGKPKPAAEGKPAQGGGPPTAFDLGGVELVDAQVVYRDDRTHNTLTISKLNLKTGRLASHATTPIDLSASISATKPEAAFDIALKASADIDLPGRAYGVRGLDAHVNGNFGEDKIDVALSAPRLELDPTHATGELLKLVANVAGAHQAHADISLENISGTEDQLEAGKLTVDLSAAQGPQKVGVHLASPLKLGLAAQSVELGKLDGELDLESPSVPQKTVKVKLDGTFRADAQSENVAARLGARFDDTTASSQLSVQGFAAPHIGFDVDLDQINVDRYLPPAPAKASAAAPGGAARPAAANDAADPKVDLSALKPLNLAGELRIGALQIHNARLAKLKLGVHAAGGHLELAPIAADLYEGSLSGTLKVDAGTNRIGVQSALKGVSIGPLLKDQMGKDLLDGHGEVKLNVTTEGATVGALRRALDGSGSLALRDGAVHGINVAQKLRDIKNVFAGGNPAAQAADAADKTDFSELTGSFTIKNGVATNNDLLGKSPLLRLGGAGTVDIGAGTLDYTVKATVVASLAGQGGSDLSKLNGVTLPVHLTGPFAAMSYQLDWGAVATQAAKSQATDKLKGLLGGKLKQGDNAPGNKVTDALKGLLGK
jgi:AsmA protein